MIPRVDEVSSCSKCPFALVEEVGESDHFEVRCGHDSHDRSIITAREVTRTARAGRTVDPPEWCPLRQGPTLVRLSETV